MKFFNSRCIFRLLQNTNFRQSFLKRQFLVCHSSFSSLPSNGISSELLNNSGVRSFLDKCICEDYVDTMSKPNVSALISAIRSLKVDLQSLNEFDTGQYNILF